MTTLLVSCVDGRLRETLRELETRTGSENHELVGVCNACRLAHDLYTELVTVPSDAPDDPRA